MEISFMPICANFHETGHLSVIFEDVFCNRFYPDLMKNVENVGRHSQVLIGIIWRSPIPNFTQICQEMSKVWVEFSFFS
jgi:hypothetical protein